MNFFKTSNSGSNMNHIDIYLEMTKLEHALVERGKQIKELEFKLTRKDKEISDTKEEISNKHLIEVKKFSDALDKIRMSSS